jgi:3-oxoacyl-[acyl-carrier protein] reductase
MICQNRFKNKVAVITGGAEGIGNEIAARLGHEGATVLILDKNATGISSAVERLSNDHITCEGHTVDISNKEDLANVMNAIGAKWLGIDVLVHAAGIVGPTSTGILDYNTTDFDLVCKVNLKGTFLVTKTVLGLMKNRGAGRILLISSIAGKEGNPGMVGYTTSKAAVIGLVKGVAKEFATSGITINGLAPAVIKTRMNENTSAEQLAYMTAKIPMQRLGTVQEVAALAAFIVSEENSFTTGFIYDISGGRATY